MNSMNLHCGLPFPTFVQYTHYPPLHVQSIWGIPLINLFLIWIIQVTCSKNLSTFTFKAYIISGLLSSYKPPLSIFLSHSLLPLFSAQFIALDGWHQVFKLFYCHYLWSLHLWCTDDKTFTHNVCSAAKCSSMCTVRTMMFLYYWDKQVTEKVSAGHDQAVD